MQNLKTQRTGLLRADTASDYGELDEHNTKHLRHLDFMVAIIEKTRLTRWLSHLSNYELPV